MTRDPHDIVKLYSGPIEIVEAHQAALSVEGITSSVVGNELTAGLGSILPAANELWVHSEDFARAEAILVAIEKPHAHPGH